MESLSITYFCQESKKNEEYCRKPDRAMVSVTEAAASVWPRLTCTSRKRAHRHHRQGKDQVLLLHKLQLRHGYCEEAEGLLQSGRRGHKPGQMPMLMVCSCLRRQNLPKGLPPWQPKFVNADFQAWEQLKTRGIPIQWPFRGRHALFPILRTLQLTLTNVNSYMYKYGTCTGT